MAVAGGGGVAMSGYAECSHSRGGPMVGCRLAGKAGSQPSSIDPLLAQAPPV